MLLEHVKGIHPDTELEAEYSALAEHVNLLLNQMNVILEAPMGAEARIDAAPVPRGAMGRGGDLPPEEGGSMPAPGKVETGEGGMDEVIGAMEQVTKQMDAAKRGLGLVNKLGDSPSRTMNRSRIMGNMNRIRANLRRIEKMLAGME